MPGRGDLFLHAKAAFQLSKTQQFRKAARHIRGRFPLAPEPRFSFENQTENAFALLRVPQRAIGHAVKRFGPLELENRLAFRSRFTRQPLAEPARARQAELGCPSMRIGCLFGMEAIRRAEL